ncbi:hypothetical protein SAMN05421503_1394 [Terribacillus aidingensis]|uniref:Uncharacterized protein n=1 Tax=Terribacillus aidingensis TaxID=586416 RepID=A0A285NLS3_9BACI|nr:hypothetical protein [Terribacillus aidingensis]SNZ09873.1 hypothetical protein SAMN05421503_1394 [Terribacillus aidingensis]
MKKIMGLLFIIGIVFLSACGEEEGAEGKNTKEGSASARTTTEEVKAEPASLKLEEKIDQFGGESLEDIYPRNTDFEILKDGDYTYLFQWEAQVVDPSSYYVSVAKDNKWVTIQNEVNIADDSNLSNRTFSEPEFIKSGNSILLLLSTWDETNGDYNTAYKLKFNPEGTMNAKLIIDNPAVDGDEFNTLSLRFVEGSNEKVFIAERNLDNVGIIYDDEGNEKYVVNNLGMSSGWDSSYLDSEKNILYFDGGSMYDLSKDDYMWTEAGDKKRDSSKIANYASYLTPQNDGLYQLHKPLGEGWSLDYSILENEEFKLQDSVKIQDELDANNAKMVVNEESVEVYTTVEYRGKPTIQKYTYNRVDL